MSAPEKPLVSVVTPSYNQGRYVEETIRSVLAQDYPQIEHIVIDGGSTDGTLDVLRRHEHLVWLSEPDEGQGDAINKGFRRARGEIVGWLNSDDLYLPGAVTAAVAHLERNPDCTVVYGDHVEIDEGGDETGRHRTGEWDLSFALSVNNIVSQPAAFFRRAVFDRVGFLDPGYRYALDYEYWLRIATAGLRFDYVPQFWAAFRYHASSKSVAEAKHFWAEHRRIARAYGARRITAGEYLHYRERLYQRLLGSRLRPVALWGRNAIRGRLGVRDPRDRGSAHP